MVVVRALAKEIRERKQEEERPGARQINYHGTSGEVWLRLRLWTFVPQSRWHGHHVARMIRATAGSQSRQPVERCRRRVLH